MKKKVCSVLICVSIFISSLCGCEINGSKGNSISENDEDNINKIQKVVKEIDGYTDELKKSLETLKESDFDQSTVDFFNDTDDKLEIINKYWEESKDMKMDSDNKSIKDTCTVYTQYLSEVSELYENVLDVDSFIIEVAKIDTARDDLWNSYSDEIDKVENTCLKWEDFMDEYSNVKCPAFMKDTYNMYVECFKQVKALYYEWYCALELQDYLRVNAVNNTINFVNEKINKYTNELLEDVKKQYVQSEKIINNRIDVYEKELKDNCSKILESIDTGKE